MIIQQGDEYALPIVIKMNDASVSPSDIDDLRIQVGEYLKSYVDGELTYDDELEQWLFPMTEEMTRTFTDELTLVQVAVKIGNRKINSVVKKINVYKSIIKKGWN